MLFLVIASALVKQRDVHKLLREGRAQPRIFCAICHTLKSLPICHGAVGEPHCDAVGQDAINGSAVKGQQQLLTDVIFSAHSQEVQMLLYLLMRAEVFADQERLLSQNFFRILRIKGLCKYFFFM